MSATINMKLTAAGQAAIWNAQGTGTQATLTHVQIGTGRRTPDGTETGLLAVAQTTTIAAGSKPSPTQIRVSCLFPGISNYDITEIGVWIGNPASGGKLFAYHSLPSGKVGTMVVGTDFVFAHEWAMEAATAAALNILADTGQSAMLAMMAAHEAASDPHPQYATDTQLAGLVGTASPTMNGTVTVGTATKYAREDHTHPSDTTRAAKAGDTFTGNIAVNTGDAEANVGVIGGSKPPAYFLSNSNIWGLWSPEGEGLVIYDRATAKMFFAGIEAGAIVQNNGSTYGINISGKSNNTSQLEGQTPAYYTNIPARLGYTPVQQGTGPGQTNSAIKIGWGSGGVRLQVDSTDFGYTWPININGAATTAGNADTVGGWHADPLRTWGNLIGRPSTIAGYGITDALVYNNGGTYGINVTGMSEYASNAGYANTAGTAGMLAASPGTAPHYAVRAWVSFNAVGALTIRASGNVSSVTDHGIGNWTVNYASPMPDENYAVNVTGRRDNAGANLTYGGLRGEATPTVWGVRVGIGYEGSPGGADSQYVMVTVVR